MDNKKTGRFISQRRKELSLTQKQLAEKLNVTFATVNRWENGRAVPNKLAQVKIYDMCKFNNCISEQYYN